MESQTMSKGGPCGRLFCAMIRMKLAAIALLSLITTTTWADTPPPIPVFYIYFDLNSATPRADSLKDLELALEYFSQHSNWQVRIQGHTDWSGPDDFNFTLSRRRAEIVLNLLMKRGIPQRALKVEWWGEQRPLVVGKPDQPIALNRRVEISFW